MRAAALDIETFGHGHTGVLLALGWDGEVYRGDQIPPKVWDELADESIAKVTHTKYDHTWLKKHGHVIKGPHIDTQVLAWLVNENEEDFSLGTLVPKYLSVDPDKRLKYMGNGTVKFTMDDGTMVPLEDFAKDLEGDVQECPGCPAQFDGEGCCGHPMSILPRTAWAEFLDYCGRDILHTLNLAKHLIALLKRTGMYDYWREKEVPFSEVLVDMECNGLPIDLEEAKRLVVQFSDEAEVQKTALLESLGYEVNIGSWQQLMSVLYEDLWEQGVEYEMTEDQRTQIKKPYFLENVAPGLSWVEKKTKKSVAEWAMENPEYFDQYKVGLASRWFPQATIQRIGTTKVAGTITRKGLNLKKPPKKRNAESDAATDSKILRKHFYDNQWVLDLLAWRKKAKAASYITSYFGFTYEGRLYGRFNRCGTVTGRLSSSDPNMMNIPSRGPMGAAIRGLFKGPGLIVGDHSQLEMRILAHYSQDPRLLDIYRTGKDIYSNVAQGIFGRKVEKGDPERDVVVKQLVLGDSYGGGPDTLHTALIVSAHMMGLDITQLRQEYTVDRVRELQDDLHAYFHVAEAWKQNLVEQARDDGYIRTIGGRYRTIDQSKNNRSWRNDFMSREDRQAVNSKIQGSAADILQTNMVDISKHQGHLVLLLCQVHDELVMALRNGMAFRQSEGVLMSLQNICENPGWDLHVPLSFKPVLVESWADKE